MSTETAKPLVSAHPLLMLDAAALSDAYRSRAVSPVDVMRAVFDEIASIDPLLRAFCETRAEAALYAARASEQRWHDRAPLSALDGVPVSIKDHIDVAGFLAPARGGPAKSVESSFDSPVAARLREAGAVIVGKTTMPELSVIPVTQTPSWGTTCNPLDPEHSPGGSSGGAAAAVAAGLCAIAIGSDGGGSIRLPAAFTGTVGHKPTLGLVPYFPGQTDRTVAGPIARSCRDIALAMDVIARPDGRDWLEQSDTTTRYGDALDRALPPLRIGFSADFGYQRPDAAVLACVEDALGAFASLGLEVAHFGRLCNDPFMTYMRQATLRLRGRSAAYKGPEAVASVLRLADALTADDNQLMIDERTSLADDFIAAFNRFDVIVSPSAPCVAPLIGDFYPDGTASSEANRNLIGYAAPFNLVHLPAISIPCGTVNGLPVGLQLGGRRFSDAMLIALAEKLEHMFWSEPLRAH